MLEIDRNWIRGEQEKCKYSERTVSWAEYNDVKYFSRHRFYWRITEKNPWEGCWVVGASWSSRPGDFYLFIFFAAVLFGCSEMSDALVGFSLHHSKENHLAGLMQYGSPLLQAETGVMVSPYWSPLLFFFLFCVSFFFLFVSFSLLPLSSSLPCLGSVPLCSFIPAPGGSWQRLILFVFFCLSGIRPERWSSVFFFFPTPAPLSPPLDAEKRGVAFEENHPQSITVELIAASG